MTILETNTAHAIIRLAKTLEEIEETLKKILKILEGKAETQD